MTDQVGIIKKAAKAAGVYDQILRIVDSDIQWVGAPVDLSAFIALQVRSMLLLQTKAEANKRILDRMPDFKQRNYIAFNLEMEKKERKGGTLTTDELAMVTFTEGEWEFAKAIRSASNVIEAEIALLTDVEAGVFDVENHIKWNV